MKETQIVQGHRNSRIIKGCWQMSSGHGGYADQQSAIDDLFAFAGAGVTTFDCADIYTGVEQTIGLFLAQFAARHGTDAVNKLRVHTKFVPDLYALGRVDRWYIENIINRSLARLGVESLHRVQFHWWNFNAPGHAFTALELQKLQQAGKIQEVAVTNCDLPHLRELVENGIRIVSNQVQYSVIDRRPAREMSDYCRRNGIELLCYGTVAGGLLSENYLGAQEPKEPYSNRSLTKYMLMVEEFGGWDAFQAVLRALDRIAQKHQVSISDVASAYVLNQPAVGGVILGASARRLPGVLAAELLVLDQADQALIKMALAQGKEISGDVFELERDMDGKHAKIMRYNLNEEGGS